jgi:hypothetical protein
MKGGWMKWVQNRAGTIQGYIEETTYCFAPPCWRFTKNVITEHVSWPLALGSTHVQHCNRSEGQWWLLWLSDKEQLPHQKMGMAEQHSMYMQTQYTTSISNNTILQLHGYKRNFLIWEHWIPQLMNKWRHWKTQTIEPLVWCRNG